MQLNMVTPMDIGLERQDGVDDSDMFDLGEIEKKKGTKEKFGSDFDSGSEEESGAEVEAEDDDEYVSDDEELKASRLESSLDDLYARYQQHKVERDAKHKAKEERRKRDAAEGGEWAGIGKEEEDSDSDVDDDPAPIPEESSDEESEGGDGSLEEEEEAMEAEEADGDSKMPASSKRAQKAAAAAAAKAKVKEAKLITKLPAPAKAKGDKTKQAAMWFDQPVIKGLPGLTALLSGGGASRDEVESDEEVEDEEWAPMGEDEEREEAEALKVCLLSSQ